MWAGYDFWIDVGVAGRHGGTCGSVVVGPLGVVAFLRLGGGLVVGKSVAGFATAETFVAASNWRLDCGLECGSRALPAYGYLAGDRFALKDGRLIRIGP